MKNSKLVNILKSGYSKAALAVCTFMVALEGGAAAQTTQTGDAIAQEIKRGLTDSANSIVSLLMVITGLYGAVQLVINGFKWSKGDQDAKDAMFKWLLGIIVIMAGLAVLKTTLLTGN